jgi:hypothetical protein
MRMGSLDGRAALVLCGTDVLRLTRGSTGGGGAIQAEQQRQWSSGKAVVCRLTFAAVCGTRSEIASSPAEFIGADGAPSVERILVGGRRQKYDQSYETECDSPRSHTGDVNTSLADLFNPAAGLLPRRRLRASAR